MMHGRRSPVFVALLFIGLYSQAEDTRRAMVPEDYYRFQFVSDAQISPDGSRVALVRTVIAEDRRQRHSAIWMIDTQDKSDPCSFTSGQQDSRPRWAPDGRRLVFLRKEKQATQLRMISVDGGESRVVTTIQQGSISDYFWLPGRDRLVLLLRVDPAVEDPRHPKQEDDAPAADVQVFTRAVYKTEEDGYLDQQRKMLWLLDLDQDQLTRLVGDPDWQVHDPAPSPSGTTIAFHADRSGGEFDGRFDRQLFLLDVESGRVNGLSTPTGRTQSALFSPDGQSIVYRYQADRYEPVQLHQIPTDGGEPRVLHDGQDLSVSAAYWPPESVRPLVRADHHGSRPLLRLRSGSRPPGILLGDRGSVHEVSFSADGRQMAYVFENETQLAEVWVAQVDRPRPRRLTRFNDPLLNELALVELERFQFATDRGFDVDGFLVRPAGFDPDRLWPMILNIKGGPAVMWGHQWFHEFQMMAGQGYAVVFANYRGSTGYGHDFEMSVRLDYGGADYRDNMRLVDEALARFKWIDPDRLFVTGGSHGGFLTNWITTRTDRFQAAATQRCVSNWVSEAGTQALSPAGMNAEFDGTLWQQYANYWDRSPLKYAHRVVTPTLIIHSTDDHITPIGQGQEWFYALLNQGVATELAMFRGEGHDLSRRGTPINLVQRLNLILDWFRRFDPANTSPATNSLPKTSRHQSR
jgi:dipeptidyl aminopeptidase/acylaminoacyl peptidase